MDVNKGPITFKSSLGNRQLAQKIAKRAFENIKAYRNLLASRGFNGPIDFSNTDHIIDKNNYLATSDSFSFSDPDLSQKAAFYLRSSNANSAFYWPQYSDLSDKITSLLQYYFEANFNINHTHTACIVAASLGSWAGGNEFSYYVRRVADTVEYSFGLFTPGNAIDEVIEFIMKYNSQFEQFILFLCPSFIAYILDTVEVLGLNADFPFHKLRFSVIGEPFNEGFRERLDKLCCPAGMVTSLLSIYGSADTNILGAESVALAALRKILYHNKALAKQMGYKKVLPHFFHYYAEDAYLEEINGNLCITKWQGIPLVRYDLHDKVHLYSWKEMREYILTYKMDDQPYSQLFQVIEKAGENLPDLIALFGRSDSNLKLKGTFISEMVLDNLMHAQVFSEYLTGYYKASIEYDNHDHQYLKLLIETKPNVTPSKSLENFLYGQIIEGLGELQHEFKEDYEHFYKKFENDPSRKAIRLKLCNWPTLSQELLKKTKRRGIETRKH